MAVILVVAWAVGRDGRGSAVLAAEPIEGAWRASEYLLASGETHALRGRIFFTGGAWTVVFFVVDAQGRPRRASAEGGTYFVHDDVVTFRHEFNFSQGSEVLGFSESPLRMEVTAPGSEDEEPTQFSIEGSVLTLSFPSGNRMTFSKSGVATAEK